MTLPKIGVNIVARDARGALDAIAHAEELGIPMAWMTLGGAMPDSLTLFAVAATRTERIRLGTSIVPIWPRHPIALAQQAAVIEALAPGRLRLGVGPSHRPMMESMFGFEWRAPQGHLREYVTVLKALLGTGAVEFDGAHYHAHTSMPGGPLGTPVMISALRAKGFRLGGAVADGVISWVCPPSHLRDVALPNIAAGAKEAGRAAPPLVAHAPVCVHENIDEVRAAAREQLGFYARVPYYAAMFADSGFPDAAAGLSDALIDALVIHGDEARVAEGMRALLAMGAGHVLAHPIAAGADKRASAERTLRLIADVAKR